MKIILKNMFITIIWCGITYLGYLWLPLISIGIFSGIIIQIFQNKPIRSDYLPMLAGFVVFERIACFVLMSFPKEIILNEKYIKIKYYFMFFNRKYTLSKVK
ncbi:MAG: hypothetical protein PHC61_10385, partial [Chitinivibrionales bacterium]|nr:hypothetical protein [Chitinivibrionales bacterium]